VTPAHQQRKQPRPCVPGLYRNATLQSENQGSRGGVLACRACVARDRSLVCNTRTPWASTQATFESNTSERTICAVRRERQQQHNNSNKDEQQQQLVRYNDASTISWNSIQSPGYTPRGGRMCHVVCGVMCLLIVLCACLHAVHTAPHACSLSQVCALVCLSPRARARQGVSASCPPLCVFAALRGCETAAVCTR
jgi:hypothetical protein